MKIWQLHTKSHQIGYPYASSHEEMQYYQGVFKKFNTGKSVLEDWKPTMICRLHEIDIGRIIQGNQEFLVLTEKAKTLLSPLLKESVEYLPTTPKEKSHKNISRFKLLTRKKSYQPILDTVHTEQQYVLNIFNIRTTEIIDFEESICEYNEESGIVALVRQLAFKPELVRESHLFKIDNPGIEFQPATFISDQFKMIVEENDLKGLIFSEVPTEEGGNLVWAA